MATALFLTHPIMYIVQMLLLLNRGQAAGNQCSILSKIAMSVYQCHDRGEAWTDKHVTGLSYITFTQRIFITNR